MKLIRIGDSYYNPEYIVAIREHEDPAKVTVQCVDSYGFTEDINIDEALDTLGHQEPSGPCEEKTSQ